MVGVGSGSALNAFNIGQQATQPTAIGAAIKSIVDNADKQGLLQSQSAAQTAGSIATEQFKSNIEGQPQDVLVQNPDGSFTKINQAPGGKKSIMGSQMAPSMGNVTGQMVQQGMPGYAAPPSEIDFSTGRPTAAGASQAPEGFVDVPGLGAIDPNAELTEEQVAAIRAAFPGL